MVIMPSDFACSSISPAVAPFIIKFLIVGVTLSTSCMPTRLAYPSVESFPGFGFQNEILFQSSFAPTIFSCLRKASTLSSETVLPSEASFSLFRKYLTFDAVSFLTRRWAMTILRVETKRNGSTFISKSLGMAPAAELVCNVENTKWPVSDALMASAAVSLSRISPTMIMSGSWRTRVRSPLAKVRPISGRTWV